MNKVLRITVIFFGAVILVLFWILFFVPSAKGPTVENAPAGGPAGPAISSDGHISVAEPSAGAVVSSPLFISGTVAGGGWFYEAVFPVRVEDARGNVIGRGMAHAAGEPGSWMTTATVPFAGMIVFSTTSYATGTVVFAKDNPSGLAENAGELAIPVVFK